MVAHILSISFCLTSSITKSSERLIEELPFGATEKERLHSIKNKSAQKLSLCALLSLKALLNSHNIKHDNSNLTVLRTENRKPYFESNELYFSLSHTDGIAVAALDNNPVGVDIEWINESKCFSDISRRFFTSDEQMLINESKYPALSFYSLWTKKEALGKLTSMGLISVCSSPPSEIYFYKQYLLSYKGQKAIISVCSTQETDIHLHCSHDEIEINEIN